MQTVNIIIESTPSKSLRAQQLSAMFDVPMEEKQRLEWRGDFPYDEEKWNIGLIVGPSGSGKSTILKDVFGESSNLSWSGDSVIDDFDKTFSIDDVSKACQSVGFNTIPAWLRPYSVLSNGEKFRIKMARLILEEKDTIVIDEFTSVVDRQVAQIASHAVQKYARRRDKKIVAASCHYDIIDWLQPDWILEPHNMLFQRRLLRPRPQLSVSIGKISIKEWKLFSKFHYMSANLHKAAQCFGLFVEGQLAAFAGILHRPHAKRTNIKGVSRLVTLPDFQGLGLAFVLVENLGAAYRANKLQLNTYPAHPALIRSFQKSKNWRQKKVSGGYQITRATKTVGKMGGRPNATFAYCGPTMDDVDMARRLISGAA